MNTTNQQATISIQSNTAKPSMKQKTVYGEIEIHSPYRQITVSGREVNLNSIEYSLLELVLQHLEPSYYKQSLTPGIINRVKQYAALLG